MSYLVLDLETIFDGGVGDRTKYFSEGEEPIFAPPACHRIVSAAAVLFDDKYVCRYVGCISPGTDESIILARLVKFMATNNLPCIVTWNGRQFDIPVITARSMRYGLDCSWWYESPGARNRYRHEGELDLMDYLADYGRSTGSLQEYARLIGLPGKLGVDGCDVEGMFADGRIDEINLYCEQDVIQTAFILLRVLYARRDMGKDAYAQAAGYLLRAVEQLGRHSALVDAIDRDLLFLGAFTEAP